MFGRTFWYNGHFVTTDDYTCLLHEATPTDYAVVRKAYTVQMHILMCTQTLFHHPYGSVTEARLR